MAPSYRKPGWHPYSRNQTSLHPNWRLIMLPFIMVPTIHHSNYSFHGDSTLILVTGHMVCWEKLTWNVLTDPQDSLLPGESTTGTVSEWFCFARSSNSFHPASGWHPFPAISCSFYLGGAKRLILGMCQIQMSNFSPFHCCKCWQKHAQYDLDGNSHWTSNQVI